MCWPRVKEEELARLLKRLRAMRRSLPSLVQLLMRLGAAKSQAGRAFQFVQMRVPEEGQPVTRETFQFRVDKQKLQEAEWRDGHLRCSPSFGPKSGLLKVDRCLQYIIERSLLLGLWEL
jgi:hypothetical protein